jgi:hypothetical protein
MSTGSQRLLCLLPLWPVLADLSLLCSALLCSILSPQNTYHALHTVGLYHMLACLSRCGYMFLLFRYLSLSAFPFCGSGAVEGHGPEALWPLTSQSTWKCGPFLLSAVPTRWPPD